MAEDALRLLVFVGVGVGLWLLSLRLGMKEYGPQPLLAMDGLMFAVGMAMIGLYDLLLAPQVLAALNLLDPLTTTLRQFFRNTHPAVQLLMFLLVTDFLGYWLHRLLHTRRWWRFHAFHHSSESLNWLSGTRGSPVHYVLNLVPATITGTLCLISDATWLFVTLMFVDAFSQHLGHSNLRLPFEKQLEYLFATPRMHFIHHHPEVRYTNSNYGFYFSICDHLFGTYVDAATVHPRQLGLDYHDQPMRQFLGLEPRHESAPKPGTSV